VNPQAFQQHIRGDSQLMAQLLQVNGFVASFICKKNQYVLLAGNMFLYKFLS
jgi:hypothetical protein